MILYQPHQIILFMLVLMIVFHKYPLLMYLLLGSQ
nr:MAG TPA: hypothetical protein [Crassvirales sp.]